MSCTKRTVIDVFDSFFARRNAMSARRLSPKTKRLYFRVVSLLSGYLGPLDVGAITEAHLIDFINDGKLRWVQSSTELYARILKSFFKELEEMRLIEASPMANIKMRKPKVRARPTFPLARLRADFLAASANDWERAFVYVASYTGARVGEIGRLTWPDIDFEGGIIRIDDQKRDEIRLVPMHPELADFLKASKPRHKYLVGCKTNRDAPMGAENLCWQFKRIATRAGLPSVTNHTFRRAVATHLLDNGVSAKVVADILGQDVQTLMKHYAQVLPDAKREAIGRL